jgi:diguanylate cyclase (GGDEF)-like protein
MAKRELPPIEDLSEIRIRRESVGAGIRLNLVLFGAGAVYVAATAGQPNRMAIGAAFALLALIALLITRLPADRIIRCRGREAFFLAWSGSTLAVITAAVQLDGGLSSPLSVLFFIPVVFAALSYPLRSVVAVGGLSEMALVTVGTLIGTTGSVTVGFFATAMAMVAVLCAWQGELHERRRRELALISRSDPLTGSLNRRGFQERLDSELDAALRDGRPLSVVLLDIDHFKEINDTRGHAAGDEALCFAAEALAEAGRQMDSVGRLGGDEFAVLLPGCGHADAVAAAQRLRDTLSSRLTAAAGVASFPTHGLDGEELMAYADAELYAVKQGRTRDLAPGRRELSWAAALARAVDLRMAVAEEHSRTVSSLVAGIGEQLGWRDRSLALLRMAGLLHDVGKVGVPDRILRKPGPLTPEEYDEVKRHPEVGADLVSRVEGLEPIVPWIAHAHEHLDGSGYPDGLAGDAIPLASRMLLVADAYAAMTAERHHSSSTPHDDAVEELQAGAGTQFDPACVEAFVAFLESVGERAASGR